MAYAATASTGRTWAEPDLTAYADNPPVISLSLSQWLGRRYLTVQVLDADGHPVQARWPAMFERLILRPDPGAHPPEPVVHGASDGCAESEDLDPERIAATTGGAGFRLADCVQVLCENILTRAA